MLYSVLPPRSDSPGWKVLDDRGEILFSGSQLLCEEFLDLADLRAASRSLPPLPLEDRMKRLPLFDRASFLLRRFWRETAGELRVSGESTAILLMMGVSVFLSTQVVWSAISHQSTMIHAMPHDADGCASGRVDAGTHGNSSCASSQLLDMACDAVDDRY